MRLSDPGWLWHHRWAELPPVVRHAAARRLARAVACRWYGGNPRALGG